VVEGARSIEPRLAGHGSVRLAPADENCNVPYYFRTNVPHPITTSASLYPMAEFIPRLFIQRLVAPRQGGLC
jgi:hypothetical protein